MQNEIVDYRYSDTDFIAYLLTLGLEYDFIEVTRDRSKQLKGYVHFKGEKSKFIELHEKFQNENVDINLIQFCNLRKKISKIIKAELLRHQAQSLG